MIKLPDYDPEAPIIVVDIGNTTTKVATWVGSHLKTVLSSETGDLSAFKEVFKAHWDAAPKKRPAATVVGSVVPEALTRIRNYVGELQEREPLVVGTTVPLPMDIAVTDAKAIGVDRVCEAAAAYDRMQTGCTVVSFGTAVTIDLVDDDGTLLGGAILPGIALQIRALHEFTAALPEAKPGFPELPFGRNTIEAIQTGVCRGLVGAIREIVEGYASHLNRWPQVVATGGGAAFMTPHCDFIDTWTADLALRGIALAYEKHLRAMGA
ncbi:MAG: type III pantothenate kinase [Planctomycetota bacterium]